MLKLSDSKSARIVEVFSSLQGEGLYVGQRQIFVRFGGCNLHCDYCDEPDTIPIPSGLVWSLEKVQRTIKSLAKQRAPEAVSFTGGEPLLHPGILARLMSWTRGQGFKNYLETNGTMATAAKRVAPLCDVIAMDIKLPSATGRETWSEHHEFLMIAPEKTFVKVVLTAASTPAEWRQVIRLMQEVSPNIPVVLQPATAFAGVNPIEPTLAIKLMRQAQALLKDVRLVPQWHPVWGLQ